MAFPASDSGYFTITALSFSPRVIAVGESVSFSITIQNTSGKSVSSCYITLSGTYPIVLNGSALYGSSSAMPANPVEGQLYFVME